MRKLQIGIVGSSNLNMNNEQDKAAWDFAYRLGFALGRTINIATLTSSEGGIAEAVTKGVNDAGGIAINLIKGNYKEDGNPEAHVNIATTMDGYDYCWPLVYSSDCLIAIGGGLETGIQISLAVDLGIHVVIYSKAGGISAEVFTSLEPTFQKMRSSQLVYLVDDVNEAIDRAKRFATDRMKKGQKVDDKITIDIPSHLKIISKPLVLLILILLYEKKVLSPQEISDYLKIPLMMIQAHLQELDSQEIVLAKKTIANEHLFQINEDNAFILKLLNLLFQKEGDDAKPIESTKNENSTEK